MEKHLRFAKYMANLLDGRFRIFGIRVGLDPILGLIPGIGDIITMGFALYLIWIGRQIGLPPRLIRKMAGNIMVDLVLGFFPVAGDIADVFYRSNEKNFKILEGYSRNDVIEGEIID